MACDLLTLPWCLPEIRQSLEQVERQLEVQRASAQGDVSGLQAARARLHQVHGALSLLEVAGATTLTAEAQALLDAVARGEVALGADTLGALGAAFRALVGYLEGLLAGEPEQPLLLYADYQPLLLLRKAERVHPVDLFQLELRREVLVPPADPKVLPFAGARPTFERGLLQSIREPGGGTGPALMHAAVASVRASPVGETDPRFWWVAQAYFAGIKGGQIPLDALAKRLLTRFNLHLRKTIETLAPDGERLMRELLFSLALAREGDPLVDAVRDGFGLAGSVPSDYEQSRYGLLEPRALRLAREALARARLALDKVLSGGMPEAPAFSHAIDAFREAIEPLPLPGLRALARAMGDARRALVAANTWLPEAATLELATAILYAEEAFAQGPSPDAGHERHGEDMAARLTDALAGRPLPAEPPSWLRELSQEAQDRQTMGVLMLEAQAGLREVERVVDEGFRDPGARGAFGEPARVMHQLAGALRLLGHPQAADGADLVAEQIAALMHGDLDDGQQGEAFDRVADSVAALGFFVETLPRPQVAADRFRFNPAEQRFEAWLTQEPPELPALPEPVPAPATREPVVVAAALPPINEELLEIFLGEADEVLEAVASHTVLAKAHPADPVHLTTLRRAFHTLKGSGRMVGLDDFGEAAWAMEQLLNQWLAEQRAADADFFTVVDLALARMRDWARSLHAGERGGIDPAPIVQAALALRAGRPLPGPIPAPSELAHPMPGAPSPEPIPTAAPVPEPAEADAAGSDVLAWENLVPETLAPSEPSPRLGADAVIEMLEIAGIPDVDEPIGAPVADEPAFDAIRAGEGDEIVIGELPLTPAVAPIAVPMPEPQPEGPQAAPGEPDLVSAAGPVLSSDAVSGSGLGAEPSVAWSVGATAEPAVERGIEALAPPEDAAWITLELGAQDQGLVEFAVEPGPIPEPVAAGPETPDQAPAPPPETVRVGDRSYSRALFEVFLGEADLLIRTLAEAVGKWSEDPEEIAHGAMRAAHSLAGSAGLLQLEPVRSLASVLEHACQALHENQAQALPEELASFAAVVDRIHAMLDRFAAGGWPADEPAALQRAQALLARWSQPAPEMPILEGVERQAQDEALPAPVDEIDAELLPFFLEEADEELAQVGEGLRAWAASPLDARLPQSLMRLLHTVKGGARMAGAMRLGQLLHDVETRVEALAAASPVSPARIEELVSAVDQAVMMFEALRGSGAASASGPVAFQGVALEPVSPAPASPVREAVSAAPITPVTPLPPISPVSPVAPVSPFAPRPAPSVPGPAPVPQPPAAEAASVPLVRVRADLLDRMVSEAGEASIARSRLDNELSLLRQSLNELTENVGRLRAQLREIEIQADTQIQARYAQQRDNERSFDPLEFDRYTRFQELTRMLAESVNDVDTVQGHAMRSLEEAGQDLHRQGQVLRDLQQDLMRARMVQFGSIADRLYRVVRQSAKETDKRVRLDIHGAAVEIDRGVLERMAGPIEHLLRNAVAHGIEPSTLRLARGKPEVGEIRLEVRQDGREIVLAFADDGAGLDLERIRIRAAAQGLIAADAQLSDRELADLIFVPGLSTAFSVTELFGRGVGMDVVRAEVAALGGRIETSTEAGRGTRFTIHLPLTLAVAQVVLVDTGRGRYALPSAGVEQVLQMKPAALASAYAERAVQWQGQAVPLFFLGALVDAPDTVPLAQHLSPVLIVRAGHRRIALHADRISRNQEVVVKDVGAQASRVRGVTGATVLGNGEIVLIINPVTLAQAVAGDALDRPLPAPRIDASLQDSLPPVVMVVDDSLTVRKVTQRLLQREGYQVLLARDGVDALRQLEDGVPDAMLLDIEMPRMDGFDLARNLRADPRFEAIPIVMISSRTADKHRNMALSLGVNAFLGKPFPEDELLSLLTRFTGGRARSIGAQSGAFTTA